MLEKIKEHKVAVIFISIIVLVILRYFLNFDIYVLIKSIFGLIKDVLLIIIGIKIIKALDIYIKSEGYRSRW